MDLKTTETNFLSRSRKKEWIPISETRFTNAFYVNFPGYHTYRVNHPDNSVHAGAVLFIRALLAYTPLPNFQTSNIQSCGVSLLLNNFRRKKKKLSKTCHYLFFYDQKSRTYLGPFCRLWIVITVVVGMLERYII